MSAAHTLPLALDRCYRQGFFAVADPGASGTINWENKGQAICEVVTATAESRVLDAASKYAVGTILLVVLKTDGGNLTITGASTGSIIMDTVGDSAEFRIVDIGGTKAWKQMGFPPGQRSRLSTSAASGAFEGAYVRLAFEADGTATGESVRAFTNVNANIGTAHGAHISLSYEAVAGGSETSGLGVAMRATTHIPDVASWAPTGTVYGAMAELFSDGAASDPAGLTELAVLCLSNSGNATGRADVDTDAAVVSIQGFTAASGVTNAISSTPLNLDNGFDASVGIRVKIGAGLYFIPAIPSADWN